ncbi:MAG: hypothetical protein AAGJ18_13605 [Bacteroidota bacterium]
MNTADSAKFFKLLCLVILVVGWSACNNDTLEEPPIPPPTSTRVIYEGSPITFEKVDGTDPADAINQDRITDNVWLTRSPDGGEIFNAKVESGPTKGSSPAGTQWAVGSIDNIDELDFKTFRNATRPREAVGKDLVLFLIEDEVFIPIKFTKWSSGKNNGGFAYERATE